MIDTVSMILLAVTGLCAGVLGGLLGVGGSVIMIPAMAFILGDWITVGGARVPGIHQFQASTMIVNFLLALPSVLPHLKAKAVWKNVWLHLTVAGTIGMALGVFTTRGFSKDAGVYLSWLVGAFFLYVAAFNLYRILRPGPKEGLSYEQVQALPAWRKSAVGFPMGFMAGLLGIGGGAWAVPAQQTILHMPLRNSIATSAAAIASIAWLGAIQRNLTLRPEQGSVLMSLMYAACLAPTAMIGSYLGAHLTHKLPLKLVRGVFVALMLASALKLFQVIPAAR